jgi:uncharacterized protein (TIGR03083 family)
VSGLRVPAALDVRGLFLPDRQALLSLLESLQPHDWTASTACLGWDVRDVALHILGGDLANIAGRRDGAWGLQPSTEESLATFINRINQEWVESARRLSPHLISQLLAFAGPLLFAHLESLDLQALGGPVSWAGPEPAQVWLDVAREYMERWVHQQHIRDAVGRPGQYEARLVGPVIAVSMHAVPLAMPVGINGTLVIEVQGEGGGVWTVLADRGPWTLREGRASRPDCAVSLPVGDWWRVVTLGIGPAEAAARASIAGDSDLARAALRAVAIIA